MTPTQWTRFKYQLTLMAENAKAAGRREIRVNRKELATVTRQYRHAFSFDSDGGVWFDGVKLVAA